jgi:hypothetical protein
VSPISTRLAAIGLTLAMTAALSARSFADTATNAQAQSAKATATKASQSRKQVVTLFDLGSISSGGGTVVSGRGYAGTPDDRRRAGKNSEPDEEERVAVLLPDAEDPVRQACLTLVTAQEVYVEHAVRITGVGHFVRHSPDDGPRPVTLRLDKVSECTAVPLK